MKFLILTTALLAGTAAIAQETTAPVLALTGTYADILSISLQGSSTEDFSNVDVTARVYSLPLNPSLSLDAEVYAKYYELEDTTSAGIRVVADYIVANELSIYSHIAYEYLDVTATENTALRALAGLDYYVGNDISVFGETEYAWNIADDFSEIGGYAEAGVAVDLLDNTTLITSIVHYYDTDLLENNQIKAEIVYGF
jgi:hypothetical protein